jgi:transposase-like protein
VPFIKDTIGGTKYWLWRAVDQNGVELDILIQSRRTEAAAKRLMRKLIRKQMRTPRVMITDKLGSAWEKHPRRGEGIASFPAEYERIKWLRQVGWPRGEFACGRQAQTGSSSAP